MKKVLLLFVGLILLLFVSGCTDTSSNNTIDVSGVYTGTGTFTKLETPEDKSWLGKSYEVKYLIEQNSDGTLKMTSINEDEGDNETFTGQYDSETGVFKCEPGEGLILILNFSEQDNSIVAKGNLTFTDNETNLQDEISFTLTKSE